MNRQEKQGLMDLLSHILDIEVDEDNLADVSLDLIAAYGGRDEVRALLRYCYHNLS